jgi:hypothetical protein
MHLATIIVDGIICACELAIFYSANFMTKFSKEPGHLFDNDTIVCGLIELKYT